MSQMLVTDLLDNSLLRKIYNLNFEKRLNSINLPKTHLQKQDLKNLNNEILHKIYYVNLAKKFEASELTKIYFKNTKSGIIKLNNNKIYCTKLPSLEGLFIKEKEDTKKFGRKLCDFVKSEFNCGGFFTSDELPRYGISREEIRFIYRKMDKVKGDGDLIAIFAYDKKKSKLIKDFLFNYLKEKLSM